MFYGYGYITTNMYLEIPKTRLYPLNDLRVQCECNPTMGFPDMLRKRAC